MGALMHDALGIGLAATQVGVLHRVLVYRVEHDSPVNALINPGARMVRRREGDDGGGLPEPARRARRRRAPDLRPRPRAGADAARRSSSRPSGLEARVIQHEMDHLDGVLILDRTPRDQRKEAMRILREAPRRRRLSTVYLAPRPSPPPSSTPRGHRHRPALVVTRPDRPAGRGRRLTPPPVADTARALGLELVQPERSTPPRRASGSPPPGADVSWCAPSAR